MVADAEGRVARSAAVHKERQAQIEREWRVPVTRETFTLAIRRPRTDRHALVAWLTRSHDHLRWPASLRFVIMAAAGMRPATVLTAPDVIVG